MQTTSTERNTGKKVKEQSWTVRKVIKESMVFRLSAASGCPVLIRNRPHTSLPSWLASSISSLVLSRTAQRSGNKLIMQMFDSNLSSLSLSCLFFFAALVVYGILVAQPGIEPRPSSVKVWSFNHWTTREVPQLSSWGQKLYLNNPYKIWWWKGKPHLVMTTAGSSRNGQERTRVPTGWLHEKDRWRMVG